MYSDTLKDPIDALLENSSVHESTIRREYIREQQRIQKDFARSPYIIHIAKERMKYTMTKVKDSVVAEVDQVFSKNNSRGDSLDPLYVGP